MSGYITGLVEGTVLGAIGLLAALLSAGSEDPPHERKWLPWKRQRR